MTRDNRDKLKAKWTDVHWELQQYLTLMASDRISDPSKEASRILRPLLELIRKL